MSVGRVFSIEEFSTFDGPGIRTTVFLKGCPLRCNWCHSPEGQKFENEILRSPNGCLGCGKCLACGKKVNGTPSLVPESIDACPKNLVRMCAIDYSAEALCGKLLKNQRILQMNGGGVTFSGGEPLGQFEFLSTCLTLLQGKLHRAIQTSGYCDGEKFAQILPKLEYALFDIKLMDEDMHKRFTGVSNQKILDNFRLLCDAKLPHIARIPLIPTVNDTEENIKATARFLAELGETKVELLPYHKMTGAKYPLAGQVYKPMFDDTVTPQPHTDIFEAFGIVPHIL